MEAFRPPRAPVIVAPGILAAKFFNGRTRGCDHSQCVHDIFTRFARGEARRES